MNSKQNKLHTNYPESELLSANNACGQSRAVLKNRPGNGYEEEEEVERKFVLESSMKNLNKQSSEREDFFRVFPAFMEN